MFRFSIRELLLVTLVFGLGLGWGMNRQSATLKHDLETMRATVRIDDDGITTHTEHYTGFTQYIP